MKAWYFSTAGRRLRYGDGRRIEPGVTHTFDGPLVMCESGLHASVKPLDALRYAPGAYAWRVDVRDFERGADKLVARKRTYLWGYDASDVLSHFARLCALDVIHLWEAPDVVAEYLRTCDESLQAAARSAARSATRSAAGFAAWFDARSAARSATGGNAVSAARSTAWSAARSATRSAAWSAARDGQNRRLYRMLMEGRQR